MKNKFLWQNIDGYLYPPTSFNMRFKGGGIKTPPPPKPVESVKTIDDSVSSEISRQKKRSYLAMGKQSTMLSGIQSMLNSRLKQFMGE